MKKVILGALASAIALPVVAMVSGYVSPRAIAADQASPDAQTKAIVGVASAFLETLGADQRDKVSFPFSIEKTAKAAMFKGGKDGRMTFVGEQYGKAVWSNYPVSDVIRPGITLGSLTETQRDAAMRLLKALLSPQGYQKVLDIMGSDQALSEGGTQFSSGTKFYTIGIFGTPSVSEPWMVQFGGHHLGLNIVIAKARGVMTPTLTGAQPAVYTNNGKTIRVLAQENDKAFALLDTLDEAQRKQAILNYQVSDLVLGPGHEGETIVPEGLKASEMNADQKALLLDLISQWAGIINPAYAKARMDEVSAGLDDTYFAWSGPTTHEPGKNGSSYYRIQGPKVIIEFSPQSVGGDLTMHVHTIYRDPSNDYGRELTAE
jgi:hypothetical protein